MLVHSEHIRLPIDKNWFQQSLAETIVWCTGLPIESDPYEAPEIKQRRALATKAGELNRRTYLSHWPEFLKKIQYSRARRMFARSRLAEISPLDAQLRSPELRPILPFDFHREKWTGIVKTVISRRAEKLQLQKRSPMPANDLAGGKVLLFSPEETLSDGAARYSSKGFFDDDNVPPWDSWVAFFDQYLISWVPSQLVELVNAGVEVNPEQCTLWA